MTKYEAAILCAEIEETAAILCAARGEPDVARFYHGAATQHVERARSMTIEEAVEQV